MSWLSWIIFGALAGWIASLVVNTRNRRSGCLFNMVVGILGALLGGFIYQAVTDRPWNFSFSLESFGVAVLGAILLLVIVSLATIRRHE
jgi:uncharacterized membrane protein YeaQ/YmgE (transglycosylase-associated protein family)